MTKYRPITDELATEVLDYCHELGVHSRYDGVDRILRLRGWMSSAKTLLNLTSKVWFSQHPGAKTLLYLLANKAGNEWLWADSVVTHAEAMYSLLRLRRIVREGEEKSNENEK